LPFDFMTISGHLCQFIARWGCRGGVSASTGGLLATL
jgi:hypothetical protein